MNNSFHKTGKMNNCQAESWKKFVFLREREKVNLIFMEKLLKYH